jgi:hypothetical protein
MTISWKFWTVINKPGCGPRFVSTVKNDFHIFKKFASFVEKISTDWEISISISIGLDCRDPPGLVIKPWWLDSWDVVFEIVNYFSTVETEVQTKVSI